MRLHCNDINNRETIDVTGQIALILCVKCGCDNCVIEDSHLDHDFLHSYKLQDIQIHFFYYNLGKKISLIPPSIIMTESKN